MIRLDMQRALGGAAGILLAVAAVRAAGAQTPGTTVPGDSARPITLTEAVRLAQVNAPAAVEARGTERANREAVRAAYAAFIPNLTLSGASGWAQGSTLLAGKVVPLNRDPWTFTNGVTADVDLFDGGRRFAQIRQARADVAAAEANVVTQQFATSLSVKQQFYAVLAARESEAAAQAQLAQAQQQFKVAATRLTAGVATKSDSLRSVIQLGNAQLALLTARNNLQTANAALTRLVATPFTVTASPQDTLDQSLAPVDSLELARLAVEGPAVRQAEANLTSARAARNSASSAYWPTLNVSATYTGNLAGANFVPIDALVFANGVYPAQKSVRFTLSYPLFNQLTRESNVVRADVALTNAEAQLRDLRLGAQQQLVQYLGLLRTAQQQMAIQQASVVAAEEDLRVQQQRYSLGASTLLDVLTSQTTLDQARAALIQARFDYRVARAQLEALIGRTL